MDNNVQLEILEVLKKIESHLSILRYEAAERIIKES